MHDLDKTRIVMGQSAVSFGQEIRKRPANRTFTGRKQHGMMVCENGWDG
jgi:hypothetical protein